MVSGNCAWDISFRFRDETSAALCGEVEYELSQTDYDIVGMDRAGGTVQTEHLVKVALYNAATFCAAWTTAAYVYGDRTLEFLRCVERNVLSTVATSSFMDLSLRTLKITGLEFGGTAFGLIHSRRTIGGWT